MLLVCYSHSEYSDVLRVQSEFLHSIPYEKVLLVDKPSELPFTKTILYDDTLNFTKKVYTTVSQIQDEYILFYHDNDIILHIDITDINKMITLMKENNIDRIDLKHYSNNTPGIFTKSIYEINSNTSVCVYDKSTTFKIIYNVQPSLWKRSALLDIMNKFDYTYRDVESSVIQDYCRKTKNMAFLSTKTHISNGYMIVTPSYVYFHIVHSGRLMPVNPINGWVNDGIDIEILHIYKTILSTYSFNRAMHKWL
jgi:hypothetical protein